MTENIPNIPNIPTFLREVIHKKETEEDAQSGRNVETSKSNAIYGFNLLVPEAEKKRTFLDKEEDSDDTESEDIPTSGEDDDDDESINTEEEETEIDKNSKKTDENRKDKTKQDNLPVNEFYLNNRQKFVNFVMDRFRDVKSNYTKKKNSSGIDIMLSQRIVMSYLNLESPYRGLLLYHGLGSGKTISSIAIFAEGYQDKQIFVVCPKQLINNYQEEVKLFNTSFPGLRIPEEIKKEGGGKQKKIRYFGYTSSSDMESLKNENLDNKVIVIDEVHNFSNAIVNALKDPLNKPTKKLSSENIKTGEDASKNRARQVEFIKDIMNKRLENGEPEEIKEHWESIKEKLNIIESNDDIDNQDREITREDVKDSIRDEIISVYEKKVRVATTKNIIPIYEKMKSAINTRFILLSGTPVINRPFELTVLYNILRGNMTTYKYTVPYIENSEKLKTSLKEVRDIDYFDVASPKKGNISYVIEVTQNPKKFLNIENDVFLKKRKNDGLVYQSSTLFEQFEQRILEVIKGHTKPKYKNNIQTKKIIYTAFPEKEEEFKKYYSDPILYNVSKSNKESKDKEDRKKQAAQLFSKRIIGLTSYFKGVDDSDVSLMASLDTKTIRLEMSEYQSSVYNSDISKEKSKGGKNKKDAEQSSSYKVKSRQTCDFALPQTCITKEKDNNAKDNNEEDNKKVVDCIKELIVKNKNFLKLDAQEETNKLEKYSPKYKKIIEQLNNSDNIGSHLIYSNFIVRGTDILSLALLQNDYVEMIIEKEGNVVLIKNLDSVKENKGKVFIAYRTSDSVAVKLAKRKIYNNDWKELEDGINMKFATIKDQLSEYNDNYQLYGKLVKAFIISKSSAEGINLKNTRFVHLIDPFWNPAVTTQVIGRARRLNSHKALPDKYKNITVYKYLMTLKSTNKNGSTDEQLDNLSELKKQETNTFLKLVKSASVDCRIHNIRKTKEDDGSEYSCFVFPTENRGDPGWSFIPQTLPLKN